MMNNKSSRGRGGRKNSTYTQKTNNNNCKEGKEKSFSTKTHNPKDKEKYSTSGGKFEAIHSNDINWWNRSPIYNDATSIQMTRIPGYPYDATFEGMSGFTADPSVMTIEYSPIIGISSNYDSPINRGFTSLYAEIVAHTNSSNLGFTQASLGMLAVSAMDVVANIAAIKRAYGLHNLYLNSNANFPRVLYRACGFIDYDTVDWEEVRTRLNTLIMDFNSLMIPKYISLFERYFQLPYNIYADEDSFGGSFYIFKPTTYYVYSDVENKAVAKEITANTLAAMLNVVTEQLQALRSTSDLGLIMGAYRRAFPQSETVTLDYVDKTFLTTPWYDRNMTWQINNMSLISKDIIALDSLSVTEDVVGDLLLCNPSISSALSSTSRTKFTNTTAMWNLDLSDAYDITMRVNSFDGITGDEWIMESTRLMIGTLADIERDKLLIETTGTEICHAVKVYTNTLDSDGAIAITETPLITTLQGGAVLNDALATIYNVTKFRNHIPVDISTTIDGNVYVYDIRDFYVSTTLTVYELAQLNRAALQSAFLVNIPTNWSK